MKSAFYQRIRVAFSSGSRQKRDYSRMFLAWSGYLLPGVLLVLVILWVKSLTIDVDRHNQYLAHLRQIQTLDARINQNVLQVRDGLLNNYDPIVNDLARLKQLQTNLQQMPSFIDEQSYQELDRLLQKHIYIWQQKEESILRFQSQNAVLINSLTYFPIAINDVVTKDTTDPALANRLNTLLRDILLFNLSTNNTLVSQIGSEISQILADFTAKTEGTAIKMVLAHARIVLDRRALVNNSIAIVMESPTAQSSESLAQAYNRRYQQAIELIIIGLGFTCCRLSCWPVLPLGSCSKLDSMPQLLSKPKRNLCRPFALVPTYFLLPPFPIAALSRSMTGSVARLVIPAKK